MRAIAFLLALSASPALAGASDCPAFARLGIYIAQHTDYAVPTACPRVVFGSHPFGLRSEVMDRRQALIEGTTYFPADDVVLLPLSVDLDSPVGQAMLLHQLVHAWQFANGAHLEVACRDALEAEAYTIEAQYLDDMGFAEEAEIARFRAGSRSRCRTRPESM